MHFIYADQALKDSFYGLAAVFEYQENSQGVP